MKIFKLFPLFLSFLVAINITAQERRKPSLVIGQFKYSDKYFTQETADRIRSQIAEAIQKAGRVNLIDNNKATQEALHNEAERRKQESAMNANTVEDMEIIQPTYLLTGNLSSLKTEPKEVTWHNAKHTYYDALLTYSLDIIDTETGERIFHNYCPLTASGFNWVDGPKYDTPQKAIDGMLEFPLNEDDIRAMIYNAFKPSGRIIRVDEGDAKKAKTVFVSLGSGDGVQKKEKLEVFQASNDSGTNSKQLIGELEITEIMADSRALAKVKKGGDAIARALEEGATLEVTTKDVK